MPMRPRSASTTLETALTIPVNIHVSTDQHIISESGEVDFAQANRVAQSFHSLTANGTDCLTAADDHWGHVCVNLVDQALVEERRMQLASAFHQKAQELAVPELLQQRRQRDAVPGFRGQAQDLRSADPPGSGGGDECVRPDDASRLPYAELRVDNNSKRLADILDVQSHGQLRVIGNNRVDANKDCIVLVAEPVAVSSSFFACGPSRLAGSGSDLAVKAHGELGAHERPPSPPVLDVKLVQPPGSLFMRADRHFDAGALEHGDSRALHALVRVGH